MKLIISPAKKMVINTDDFAPRSTPTFLVEARQLHKQLQSLSYAELKSLWHCSDNVAQTNYRLLQQADLDQALTPAIMAFSGIQYQYMAPDLFTAPALSYVQTHLRILSGLYGILRPFDGVIPYRLEMQAPLQTAQTHNLYDFWGDRLYTALQPASEPIINLASNEYAKSIRPYLRPSDQLVDIKFAHLVDGKLKTRATLAKMARGSMVRFIAENQLESVADLTTFNDPNYQYDPVRSTDSTLIFIATKGN